ncbi:hypothetical protein ABZ249_25215 [Nocardiopsis sp. NPDC006139]|uniref:hypothetical protein n=1 Tax=Nocardiopsis sp. NPDC006139 TaxID=3154578 RepID=UPI0033B52F99
MTAVCDIAELPTETALRSWADEHGVPVRYLGPTLEARAVYAATVGTTTRVAVSKHRDPYPLPLIWHSPLEEL